VIHTSVLVNLGRYWSTLDGPTTARTAGGDHLKPGYPTNSVYAFIVIGASARLVGRLPGDAAGVEALRAVGAGDQLITEVTRTTTKPIARFKVRKPEPPRRLAQTQ
jgi:hypothetical protein